MDEERPARRWELSNAEARIERLEQRDEREDRNRNWRWGVLFVSFITLVDNILLAIVVYYVLRIHR